MKRNRITHVAIRFENRVYSLPAPNRHHHVIWEIVRLTGVDSVDNDVQGFLDDTGRFLTRRQALLSAREHGQLKDPANVRMNMLFSEDVW